MRKTLTAIAAVGTATALALGLTAAATSSAAAATIKIKPVAAPTRTTAGTPLAAAENFARAVAGTPVLWAQVTAKDWRGSSPLDLALAKRIEPLYLPLVRAPERWARVVPIDPGDAVTAQMGLPAGTAPVKVHKVGPLAVSLDPAPACHTVPRDTIPECTVVVDQMLGYAPTTGWTVYRELTVTTVVTASHSVWYVREAEATPRIYFAPPPTA